MCDIPTSILHFEQQSIKYQIKFRGTVKASLLEGDTACPNLVAYSIYDTNPVNYLSMVCDTLKWAVMKKPCFNVETGMGLPPLHSRVMALFDAVKDSYHH